MGRTALIRRQGGGRSGSVGTTNGYQMLLMKEERSGYIIKEK